MRVLIFLPFLALLVGCSSTGRVISYQRTNAIRVATIQWQSPKEVDFTFCDNVALFWTVDKDQSYLEDAAGHRLGIRARPGCNPNGTSAAVKLYISRADGRTFTSGRYAFCLVLHAAFPDYPKYKTTDIEKGAFELKVRPSLMPGQPQRDVVHGAD